MVQGRGARWETGNISAVDISRAPSQARCGKTQGRIEDNSELHSGKSGERRAQGSQRSAHNSIMDELRKLELVSCECVCDGKGNPAPSWHCFAQSFSLAHCMQVFWLHPRCITHHNKLVLTCRDISKKAKQTSFVYVGSADIALSYLLMF